MSFPKLDILVVLKGFQLFHNSSQWSSWLDTLKVDKQLWKPQDAKLTI